LPFYDHLYKFVRQLAGGCLIESKFWAFMVFRKDGRDNIGQRAYLHRLMTDKFTLSRKTPFGQMVKRRTAQRNRKAMPSEDSMASLFKSYRFSAIRAALPFNSRK